MGMLKLYKLAWLSFSFIYIIDMFTSKKMLDDFIEYSIQ